jgi:hypothetical protein
MKITIGEENQLPLFINHKSARTYFKNKFGNLFVMVDTDLINGEKMYLYHLVLDKPTYLDGREKLKRGDIDNCGDYIVSYQDIQIGANGSVKIFY